MKATITQSRNRSFTEKFIRSGFNVYVESNVTELADKWFNDKFNSSKAGKRSSTSANLGWLEDLRLQLNMFKN